MCGVLERIDFSQFLLLHGVVVLKNCYLTVFTWQGVVVLKELIFHSFYYWEAVVVLKKTEF